MEIDGIMDVKWEKKIFVRRILMSTPRNSFGNEFNKPSFRAARTKHSVNRV